MPARLFVLMVCVLGLIGLANVAGQGGSASASLQEASPAATPEAAESPTPAPDEGVVTLVAWYALSESGEFLEIGPLRTNDNLVAGPGEPTERTLIGDVDFDDPGNDDLPRITLGESAFNAYPFVEGDPDTVQRWLYFNNEPGVRPATLVLQIEAVKGPYQGYIGTATFVSRASGTGGVLVIVLRPPAEE